MPPPLPVPSKAAIRALRGLALGTSCAIGVIVEDRRRRISTLKTAIENKKKLKSYRQYHGSLEPASLPHDADEAVLSTSIINNGDDDFRFYRRSISSYDPEDYSPFFASSSPSSQSRAFTNAAHAPVENTQQAQNIPLPGLHILQDAPERPCQPPTPQEPNSYTGTGESTASRHTVSGVRLPMRNTTAWGPKLPSPSTNPLAKPTDPASLAQDIDGILSSHDEDRINRALALFLSKPATNYMHYTARDAWFAISVRLSKECQAHGRWEDSYRILSRLLELGPVNESRYYDHDPFPIIESFLPSAGSEMACSLAAFSMASKLFLATFIEQPHTNSSEVERVGRRLLQEALSLKQFSSVHEIYRRVLCQIEDEGAIFTGWVIEKLSEHHDYKSVVKLFLLNFSKLTPDEVLFNETGDRVVQAVEVMQGLKASQVLRAFARMKSADDTPLKTAWAMRLLQAHWSRHRDLAQSRTLFQELGSLGLLDKVYRPQRVYSVMVELAIRADENDIAATYYDELVRLYPQMAWDIPLKGYFAFSKAKAGDWEGVYNSFTEMRGQRHLQQKEYDDAFVVVLKVFAATHPVADVREFVTAYTRDLHVGMHRYVVTLVANKYGECHDFRGFLAWLQYCSDAGFSLDPAFSNAVLHNCRARWKFDFEQLKRLVSVMRQLNPGATDDTTERILSQASRVGASRTNTSAKTIQIRHRSVAVNKLAYIGRSTNKHDVYEAMNQEIGSGKHTAAIAIYKRAMRFGMPFCSHCFRLAVTAALEHPGNGYGPAFHLIQTAHEQGQDVTSAVSAFIRVQMDRFRAGTSDVIQHIQNLISRFESLHIVIDSAVLTHAALVCIKLGQHDKAISLCKLAMERSGSDHPCFSRQSFRVLLLAHSQLCDPAGLEGLLAALLTRDFASEKKTLLALKAALKQSRSSHRHDSAIIAVQRLLREAIENVKRLRVERLGQGVVISHEALRIMSDAAAEFEGQKPPDTRRKLVSIPPPKPQVQQEGNVINGSPDGWSAFAEAMENQQSLQQNQQQEQQGSGF